MIDFIDVNDPAIQDDEAHQMFVIHDEYLDYYLNTHGGGFE